MLKELVNRMQGQVRLRVEAAFPERVLNLCGARHLSFWDVEWESATVFTCRMGRRDSRVLRQAVREMDCTVTVIGRALFPAAVPPAVCAAGGAGSMCCSHGIWVLFHLGLSGGGQ